MPITILLERIKQLPYYLGVMHYAFGAYPALFFPLYRWREGDSDNIVKRDTQLVVEGYPRCGNTFAVIALKMSQPQPIKTADHVHVPAQIIRAARYGIPACVVIRNPEDVVRSLLVKYPRIQPQDALAGYIRFYKACDPYRDAFVAATFDQVTTDLAGVIDRINSRFAMELRRFEHTEANLQQVFAALDERNSRINQGRALMSYYPNELKDQAKKHIDLDRWNHLLQECRGLFFRYTDLAV